VHNNVGQKLAKSDTLKPRF